MFKQVKQLFNNIFVPEELAEDEPNTAWDFQDHEFRPLPQEYPGTQEGCGTPLYPPLPINYVLVNEQKLTPFGQIKLTAMNELLGVCNDDDLDAVLRVTLAVLKSRGFVCLPGDVDAIMFDLWKQVENV